jgi:hypothetical protein
LIQGKHFFYKTNGTEFFLQGIAYQQEYAGAGNGSTNGLKIKDPLADEAACARDVPLMAALNTNTIRVYAIDPNNDHSKCMSLLADYGIYVIQDLSNPADSINRDAPEWNTDLFATYAAVIDEMAQYTNTLGFFAGNEVSDKANNTAASAFVKAAVRDSKAYIKTKGYRPIGVGYATNDNQEIRDELTNYFNCGDAEDAIDFWGYNIYSWCGKSSYTESGFDKRTEEFRNYTVPAFFAEYGCNVPQPRLFDEVQAIYGKEMTEVFSGGIVYMWFQEANDYGLVEVDGNSVSKLPDYTALSKQMAKIKPTNTPLSAYKVTATEVRACPTIAKNWAASSDLPPIVNPELCECGVASLECVAADDLDGEEIGDHFSYVCGNDESACAGIVANATTGVYGSYSMCNAQQKLSFAFNQWYINNKKAADACNFGGSAKKQTSKVSDQCKPLVSAAGAAGTGIVTAVPTAGSGSGQAGSGTGSAGSSTSTAAAVGSFTIPKFATGLVGLSAYVTGAVMVGAGMIFL